jgi:hypothetical protein
MEREEGAISRLPNHQHFSSYAKITLDGQIFEPWRRQEGSQPQGSR